MLRTWFAATGAKTNHDALIGAVGRVESDVTAGHRGYVKIDGDSWALVRERIDLAECAALPLPEWLGKPGG